MTAPEVGAAEIAEWVGGRLVGDGQVRIRGVARIEEAGPTQLTFVAGRKYLSYLRTSAAGVVLLRPEFEEAPAGSAARIVVADPVAALIEVVRRLVPDPRPTPGVHATAVVGSGTVWGPDVEIGPFVVLGPRVRLGARARVGPGCVIGDDAEIGDDVRLVARVTVYPRSVIGARALVHAGTVIGADGFGFVPGAGGPPAKVPHVGRVVIEEDVELGANCAIDRGSLGDTVIGAGTRVDNLVHVAHNVRIGKRCLIAAQVGIAGSSVLGDDVVLGGQAGIADHQTIRDGARVGAQAGVIREVPPGERYSGTPARPVREWLRATAALNRLAGITPALEALVKRYGSRD